LGDGEAGRLRVTAVEEILDLGHPSKVLQRAPIHPGGIVQGQIDTMVCVMICHSAIAGNVVSVADKHIDRHGKFVAQEH